MQFKVVAFLTFNVSTCKNRTNVQNSINIYDRFTHMCRAGFVDDIQLITVFATVGLFLIKTYYRYLTYMLFAVVF